MPERQSESKEKTLPRAPILVLAGPTAAGKTALSLRLGAELGGEIVNADSMQVYRHMDIGTAKASKEERSRVPHHMLDVADPDESFDAGRYLQLARPVIAELHARGKLPVVVGGTGLYLKVLTRGICSVPPEDPEVRRKLRQSLEEKGSAALHAELEQVDAEAAERIHPNDRQRILRALEVYRITGEPLSQWQRRHRFREKPYDAVKVFLYRNREELEARIHHRTRAMMEAGFLEEVRSLLERGYGPGLKPMQSLGYKQLVAHIQGRCSLEEAIEEIQKETRRYAKRQMTWFRSDPELQWFHADEEDAVLRWVRERKALRRKCAAVS